MEFPKDFTKNILEVYGEEGSLWLTRLPDLLQTVSQKWSLQSLRPVKNLSYNFVAQVELSDGRRAILKMGPAKADYSKEILWLSSYADLAPQIFDFDKELNAFFMEELIPGETLQALPLSGKDDEATRILARLISQAYGTSASALPKGVPHLSELSSSFDFLEGHVDKKIFEKGKDTYRNLSQPSADDVFLHGDLHHDNVLFAGDRWKIIDPHGYIGDKTSEVGSMIYNPLNWCPKELSLKQLVTRRLDILCEELPFDAQRIRAWAFAKTMLSISWSFEGGQKIPPQEMAIAEILHEMVP